MENYSTGLAIIPGICYNIFKLEEEWLRKTGYEVTTFDHGRCYTLYEIDSDEEEEYFSISGYYDLEKNEFVETERV